MLSNYSRSQCGGSEFCNGNTGLYSNNDAYNIAYDNIGACFHSSFIKEPNSLWRTWGADMQNDGYSPALSPISINSTNYPSLTGTIYKIAVASEGTDSQLIVLTSNGLFVGGYQSASVSDLITSSDAFQRITVNGKTDGLPLNVNPDQIKMLFATTFTLIITTCSGEVHVLSQNTNVRGNGGVGSETQWSKVMQNVSTTLTNVIVARGNSNIGFALKADGTLWTWGDNTFLGDGTSASTRIYATQMTLPAGIPGVKMIQSTHYGYFESYDLSSYYILGTDKKIYSLGENGYGQLGDRTSVNRTTWVNAKNPDGSVITDAAWISANEHDNNYPGIAVIKFGGVLYTAGSNSRYMVGAYLSGDVNFLDLPTGVASSDVITQAEVGGHSTALVKLGSIRYGYVGHRVDGSMGDGTALDEEQTSFDFITPPIVAVCGTICVQPTLTTSSPVICPGSDAVFTISGTAGDIVTYSLNNATSQTATIGANGSVSVTVAAAIVDQNINLSFVLGGTGSCSNFLTLTASITVSSTVTPQFTQVAPICSGAPLSPLPTTSNNGITGTWLPALNNSQTTNYTFTPTDQGTCITQANMTISVLSNTAPVFTPIAAICEGAALGPLPTTSNNGIAGSWSPATNNLQTTTYTFTPTGGSCIDLVTMTIVVNPKPTPTFTQVAPICQGNSLGDLPLVSTNGLAGTWLPAINNQTTTTYTFTPTDFCALTVPMTIVVNQRIVPVFSVVDAICFADSSFNLPSVSNNGINGAWSPAFSNTQSASYIFIPDATECATTASKALVVYDAFDFEYLRYCLHGELQLEILPTLQSFDGNLAQYNWQFAGNNIGNNPILNVTSFLKSTTANETMPISFDITVTTVDNCPKTKTITLESVYCGIQKGISPNGDGLNEFFDLRLLDVKKLSIFNRYGTKVFSQNDYTEEWHGQDYKGNILPDATYYYVIDFNNSASKTGWIYINKEH